MRSSSALLLGCCLAVCCTLACPEESSARGWRKRFAADPARPTPAQNPYAAKRIYPQYDAGFHARHLQNIGIPSGDVGLRGNGITLNPW
jgi:hypothetical protein